MSDTATGLLAVLRRHYLPDNRPPGGVFAAEIESPDGNRRADAIWMPTTWAGQRELIGHELKVTRADVQVELADPTKHDAWARYCHRWWLVVAHPALVDGLDVPEHWGIMAPPSGRRTRSMTIVRPAPKLSPVESGPGFRRIAVWLAHRGHSQAVDLRTQLQYAERERDSYRRQVDELRATSGARVDPKALQLQRILRAVEKYNRDHHVYGEVEEADIVAALCDLAAVRSAAQSAKWDLQRLVRSAEELTEPLKHTAEELAKLAPPTLLTGVHVESGEAAC